MGPGAVEKANDTIMGGVQCLNALFLATNSDCVQINRRENRAKNDITCLKKINIFQSGRHIFFLQVKSIKNKIQFGLRVCPLI